MGSDRLWKSFASAVSLEIFGKTWAHNPTLGYGGYGYNYQYLGNSRVSADGQLPFGAHESLIERTSETIAVSDTNGVRRDDGSVGGGEYTIDPPLTSSRGSGNSSGFYGNGAECGSGNPGPGVWRCRSTPAERHAGWVAVLFADSHAKTMKLGRMDDYDGIGIPDNGFWNGRAEPVRQ